jgi:uncharacterized protein YneF (UPF0154 family)
MEILTILTTGALCIVSFIIGARTVQNVKKDKDIELPNINPLKAIRERQEHKEQKKEQSKLETIMRNIEAYDGTSNRQEDIPQ